MTLHIESVIQKAVQGFKYTLWSAVPLCENLKHNWYCRTICFHGCNTCKTCGHKATNLGIWFASFVTGIN